VSPIPDFEAATASRTGGGFPGPSFRLAGYTIVTLDLNYVRERLFPAIARRHFARTRMASTPCS
jgi:hypothetical protein